MPLYEKRQLAAEINRDRITRAAITIQAIRRGIVKRRQIKSTKQAAIILQRIWRGFLAREIATHVSMLRDKQRAHMLWYSAARTIQKTFRAFYCRRYRHSYYERQSYLEAVKIKNQHICEVSEAVAEKMYEERTQILDEQERQEFETLTTDLHHLKSTANCPGVYNSPYVEPIRAFGTPMEQHLQNNFKKSKYCHRHMRRALGSVQYQRTYQRFGQTTGTVGQGVNTGGSSYQYASMPRPVDAYKLQPLHEEN